MFNPQRYHIEDLPGQPFIDKDEIEGILSDNPHPSADSVRNVIEKSLSLERLSLQETAVLLNADEEFLPDILSAAGELKKKIYGDRIVLFAPLYVGNKCSNDCVYCGFRKSNLKTLRRTLSLEELADEVRALEGEGQKRLILVYGEHRDYSPEFIADTVRKVYETHADNHKINRVNINAAPLDVEGFATVREAGIGTYQIFQETYDPEIYPIYHPSGRKSDYNYRLTALDRAMEAGIDDVGLGVLLGLGDWRFEVMSVLRHVNHLEACFNIGPHTISFPRIKKASSVEAGSFPGVSDEDFKRIIAVLRLAVPYSGLILTARENGQLRDELIGLGVSQIDAGSQLEIGGYSNKKLRGDEDRKQFNLDDSRTLHDTISELVKAGNIPSFCTACYRKGRTGEHFMSFSTKGFIKKFCARNAYLTFYEYLRDYGNEQLRTEGIELIRKKIREDNTSPDLEELFSRIDQGENDILF